MLPTRTPADATSVFFQPRQVDASVDTPAVVDDAPPPEPETADAAPSSAAVVPIGEDLTGERWTVDGPVSVDRFDSRWPVAFAFNHHQVPGSGEDSEPILRTGRDVGVVAVFDGMGGAGGTVYETPEGSRSGAYLASRVARDIAEPCLVDWLNTNDGTSDDGATLAQLIQLSVQQALQVRLEGLRAPVSRLRSKLLRALPTTMAAAAAQRRTGADNRWSCEVLWAGDSRVYYLDAAGLHQLTADDIRDHGDAMANLKEDSVVSNAMSADTPFVVNHLHLDLTAPFALIAATDGCFGYLPSPMHFEHLLLSTLHGAATAGQWSDAARTAITAVAGDDASMAVAAVDIDLPELQALTADRLHAVGQRWVEPLEAANAEVEREATALAAARLRQAELSASLWAAYRPDYARHLPTTESKDDIS